MVLELPNYNRREQPNWCSGCGNFSILLGVKKALSELDLPPHQVVLASGVGCFAKLPYWIKTYGFVGLHGRTLPVAQGIKLANPKLKVIALAGDGDGYGEGGNHFIHACRRNVPLTYLVHNNGVFGLTTGQYSPTAFQGTKSKSSPSGSVEKPLNPLALALASGATFVARAYTGNLKEMAEIIKQALQHDGFAFVDIIQTCPSFGHESNYYNDKIYYLTEPIKDRSEAMRKALEYEEGKKIALGVLFKKK